MKSIVIISVLLFASCQNSGHSKTYSDTSLAVFRNKESIGKGGWTGGNFSFSITKSNDTFNWKIFKVGDTIRTASGKAVFDSTTRQYKFQTAWVEIADSELRKVQIHFLPK